MTQQHPDLAAEQALVDHAYDCLERSRQDAWKLRDMSEPYHVHGFRSSLTDWAANEGFPDAVVEAVLAHKTPDAVQAAYRRTTYLGTPDKPGARITLMQAWGR